MEITEHQLEQLVINALTTYDRQKKGTTNDIDFSNWICEWLKIHRMHIACTTYFTYSEQINKIIVPYFKENPVAVNKIKAIDIERFYMYLSLKGCSNNTILKYHANIYSCLDYAEKHNLVNHNVAKDVVRPKKRQFCGNYYTIDEMKLLLNVLSEKPKMKTPVMLACILGLRRGEIIGLTWNNIDFNNGTVLINQKAYLDKIEKKTKISEELKTSKSRRVLKMPESLIKYLKYVKVIQQRNFKNTDNFVCLDDNGNLLRLDYLSREFPKFLVNHNLKRIRFHDLRHSCASMLIALGVSMKDVQEWLGHADFATTSNIYVHLYNEFQNPIAEKINKAMTL